MYITKNIVIMISLYLILVNGGCLSDEKINIISMYYQVRIYIDMNNEENYLIYLPAIVEYPDGNISYEIFNNFLGSGYGNISLIQTPYGYGYNITGVRHLTFLYKGFINYQISTTLSVDKNNDSLISGKEYRDSAWVYISYTHSNQSNTSKNNITIQLSIDTTIKDEKGLYSSNNRIISFSGIETGWQQATVADNTVIR